MGGKAQRSSNSPGNGLRPRCVRWTSIQIVQVQRQMLIAAGQDPSVVPDEPFRFIKLPEVRERLGLSTASIYRAMAAGKIPRPIAIDGLTTANR